MKRVEAIKAAISCYNAQHTITAGGKEMTIAEAIAYQNYGAAVEKDLIEALRTQLAKAEKKIRKEEEQLDEYAAQSAEAVFGKKDKVNATEYTTFIDTYKKNNESVLVDPIKVNDELIKRSSALDAFMSDVDSAIQTANAINEITITY